MKNLLFLSILCFMFSLSVNAEDLTKDNTGYAKTFSTQGCIYYSNGIDGSVLYYSISNYSGTIFDTMAACVANEIYEKVIFDGPYKVGTPNINKTECVGYNSSSTGCSVTIIYGDGDSYSAKLTNQACTSLRVQGTKEDVKDKEVTLSGFNSPFLYSQNSSYQNLQITINSAFNNYQNQAPAFNNNNGWQVTAENNHFIVNNKPQKHLFYELAMNKVILNRNGQNFTSKQDLTNYLQNSDFFTKLGLNEIQKTNSLNYILPQLPVANNYYLTILSDSAIQEISELNINPAPKQLNRIYYAIYPTASPVKITGDLVFPVNQQTKEFTILESGEILVKPEMFVFWE